WRFLSWISSNSRTFSIAMTAWAANVVTRSICLSVKGGTVRRISTSTPIEIPSRNRGTPRIVCGTRLAHGRNIVIRLGLDIENLDGLTSERHTAGDTSRTALKLESQHLRVDIGRKTVARCVPVDRIFQADDRHHMCFAKSCGGFDQRVEHGLQVEA